MKIKRKLRTINYDIDRKLWRAKQKIRGIIRRRLKGAFTVGEIISMTYEKIKKRYAYQEIVIPGSEVALIADDSDYHRTRKGFMKYDSIILVRLGDKTWALGKGNAWGDYPADPYDSDILVLEMWDGILKKPPEKIAEELMPWIRMSYVFSNSIIAGRSSGHLFITKGSKWEEKVMELIEPKLSDFIQKELETHKGYVALEVGGIVPAVKSSIKYKKELAEFLAKTIIEILSDSKS